MKLSKGISFVLALVLMLSLASCSKIVKLSYDESGMLCSEKGLSYNYAPAGYEPVSIGDEWALVDGKMKESLYKIGDADPEKWLTTEYLGNATVVYYASDIKLPTLREMDADTVYFCEKGDTVIALAEIGDDKGEGDLINSLVHIMYSEDAELGIWPRADVNESFELRFYSKDYPTIYYTVTYAVCAGGNYIYDIASDRCVLVGDLLAPYHENTYDSTEV